MVFSVLQYIIQVETPYINQKLSFILLFTFFLSIDFATHLVKGKPTV